MKTHDHDNAHSAQRRAVAQQAEHGEAANQLAHAGADTFDHHLNHSPRMVAQRQLLGAAFGPALQQPVQREAGLDDEKPALQAKQEAPTEANLTGMPNQLKSGVEALSGMDMSDVRVHRNSDKPAQLNALAYAQGNDIHLGPGQEQHLPHEAWHVVQQRQGRVQATMQMAGVGVNDDVGLEEEADAMGAAAQLAREGKRQDQTPNLRGPELTNLPRSMQVQPPTPGSMRSNAAQRKVTVGVGDDAEEYEPMEFVAKHWGFDDKAQGIFKRWVADGQPRSFASTDALKAAVNEAKALPDFEPPNAESENAPPPEFSLIEHYSHKAPQVLDLATSARRQRMLVTSTLTRTYLNAMDNPAYVSVPAEQIQLLHPNDLGDSKTKKRFNIVRDALRRGQGNLLTKERIAELLPSDEEIQVAKTAQGQFMSMQGVGRIVAIKEAGKAEGRTVVIQIKCFDLSATPFLPGQLQTISESYQNDESAVSKTIGTLVTAGLIVGLGALIKMLVQ